MATDVANAIMSSSKEAFDEHCNANACEVHIMARRERLVGEPKPFILKVTPTENHVLIQYEDLTFRAPRADGTAFREMLSSLYGMLADKWEEEDKADKEHPDFEDWQADMEESYRLVQAYQEATFRVVRQGKVQVELQRVAQGDLEGVFVHHMGAMRFLSC